MSINLNFLRLKICRVDTLYSSFFLINSGVSVLEQGAFWGNGDFLRIIHVLFSHSVHDLQRKKPNKIKYIGINTLRQLGTLVVFHLSMKYFFILPLPYLSSSLSLSVSHLSVLYILAHFNTIIANRLISFRAVLSNRTFFNYGNSLYMYILHALGSSA